MVSGVKVTENEPQIEGYHNGLLPLDWNRESYTYKWFPQNVRGKRIEGAVIAWVDHM